MDSITETDNSKKEILLYEKFFKPKKNQVLTQIAVHIKGFNWDFLYDAIYHMEPKRFSNYVLGFAKGFNQLTQQLFNSMLNNTNPLKLRFFSFCAIMTFYRRRKAYDQMRSTFDKFEREFESVDMLEFYRGVVLKHSDDLNEVARAIDILDGIVEKYQDAQVPGFFQAYADAIMIGIEKEIKPPLFDKTTHIKKAENRITKAIMLSPKYPKYHATLAQIQFHQGKFDDAMINSRKATRLEDPTSPEHAIKLLDYQSLYLKAEIYRDISGFEEAAKNTKSEIEKLERGLSEAKGRSVEFLGVFSALIALVIATTSFSTTLGFSESVLLLMILGGMLIILVEAMMVRLAPKERRWEPALFVIAGFVLIIIAIIMKIIFADLGIV